MMKMEIGFGSLLDIALGGPEIGPLNMSILHGLLREVFQKLNISNQSLLVEEEDPDFSESFDFIKNKFDANNNRPRTPRGGYNRGKSKVSVIVTDYFRNPLGNSSTNLSDYKNTQPSLVSADVEDRIRYLESQLKGLKAFPSVDELREWAREKKNPDTVVTDLWHFVSLNHRMDGAEEGIRKLSELVDKLIPELKQISENQGKINGQIDDLYNQIKALSDHTSRIDDRIDSGVLKAEEKLQEILHNENELCTKLNDYAKCSDLEGYVPVHVFDNAQEKVKVVVEEIKEDISTKVPFNELDKFVSKGDVEMLSNWVKILRAQMETVPSKDDLLHMDLYVKWPQLEDALTTCYSSRPCSRQGCSANSSRPAVSCESNFENGIYQGCADIPKSCHKKKFPTESCLQRLEDLGMVVERQSSLMDALQSTREELLEKVNKNVLDKYVTQEDLQHLLSLVKDLRQEVNSIQNWRENVDEEKIPALRELLVALEKQVSDLLTTLEHLNHDRNQKDKQIDNLFTFVEGLEQKKMDKDDSCLQQFARKNSIQKLVQPVSVIDGFMTKKLPQLNTQSGIFNQNMLTCENENELLNKSFSISSLSPVNPIDKESGFLNKESSFNNASLNDNIDKDIVNLDKEFGDFDEFSELDKESDDTEKEPGLYKELADVDKEPQSSYVNKDLFEKRISKLDNFLKKLVEKFKNHKNIYKTNIAAIFHSLDNKLDRWELQPLQDYLEDRYNSLTMQQEEFQQEAKLSKSGKFQKGISLLEGSNKDTSSMLKDTGKPFKDKIHTKNNSASTTCNHPHYGNGFLPQEKEAAAVRKQMKFNCLSCDRPLVLQSNSHLQTIRGRPFNAYELDQLRLLQKVLRGDNPKKNRSCGGEYTTSPPQKINVRINTGMSLPSVSKDSNQPFIDNEIDIEGVDGRLYRGLISRKDLAKQHPRSKSETAELRTVSPRFSSGKSNHSMSGGFGNY